MKKIITKRGFMLFIFIIGLNISIFAQLKTVTGQVKDDFGPLPGVSVQIKGTVRGVITDKKGKYNIQVLENDILVFSYTGYTPQEVRVAGKSIINVIMHEEIEQLLAYHPTLSLEKKTFYIKKEENEWLPKEYNCI